MNSWSELFGFSIAGAAVLLSFVGLWFSAVMPGIDRWGKRFFVSYFSVFLLCCLAGIVEMLFQRFPVPPRGFYLLLLLESLLFSLPLLMLTDVLLRCSGEKIRSSRLRHTTFGLWLILLIVIACAAFRGDFIHVTPERLYYRGPLYPLLPLPAFLILLLNLAGTIQRRKRLSRKVFYAFLIAQVPITVAMLVQLFIDVFPLISIGYILSALAMYSLILSDQIERDLNGQRAIAEQQREIAEQQREIAEQQREIANERASVMVLQMRPHFIYNTLMSIYGLCKLDPMKARQVTMDFTNYLRRNFSAVASENTVPFTTELEHTRAYLAVEQAQYDEMLVVEVDTPFTAFRLPPLTLQPIVENAVKHGMDLDGDPLRISIRTRHTNAGVEIIVMDSGRGFDSDATKEPGIALNNIRQRLEIMCGGCLSISSNESGGTVVTLMIPESADEET